MTGPEVTGDQTPERKAVLLRLDPRVHAALARWAADDLRSVNAQLDWILRQALQDARRMPRDVASPRSRGRPAAAPRRPAATQRRGGRPQLTGVRSDLQTDTDSVS